MKNWWKVQSVRIDALSLRERAFLFVTLLATCVALVQVLWLEPAQRRLQQETKKFKAQELELRTLQVDFKNNATGSGPAKTRQAELAGINTQIAATNQAISQVPSGEMAAAQLPQVLTLFLRRHEGLTLVKTATVSELPAKSTADKGVAAVSGSGLKQQGLELTVAGAYPELIRYVQTLERSLPALRWGPMTLVSEKQPPQLTLQVYLVGESP
jgi:MSHA biogenesis protein MshJ